MYDTLQSQARDALADYLQKYPWSYWYTATSKTFVRYPRQIIRRCTYALSGSSRGIVVAERHYLGGWHAHGLVNHPVDPGALEGARLLFETRLSEGGYSRVDYANSTPRVCAYIAKYLTKDQDVDTDWDIWGDTSWGLTHRLPMV